MKKFKLNKLIKKLNWKKIEKVIFYYLIPIITFFIVILSYISTNKGLDFSEKSYNLSKKEIEKKDDPIFTYSYLKEEKKFKINSPDDIELRGVSWLMPALKDEFKLHKINQISNDLTYNEIIHHFLLFNLDKTGKNTEYFLYCFILNQMEPRFPAITEIEFRRRGEVNTYRIYNLVYLKGTQSESPYFENYKVGVSENEINNFIIEQESFIKSSFDQNIQHPGLPNNEIDLILNGEKRCPIQFGAPDVIK